MLACTPKQIEVSNMEHVEYATGVANRMHQFTKRPYG